jgi:hypothetical protein
MSIESFYTLGQLLNLRFIELVGIGMSIVGIGMSIVGIGMVVLCPLNF